MLVQRDKDILRFVEKYGGITIYQCAKMYFKNAKHSYDLARKRLKKIYDMGLLKYYTNKMTDERVYYIDRKLSPHDIYVYNFYAELIYYDAVIHEFIHEPRWMGNKYRSDGFFKFSFNGIMRIACVEVDLTHNTNFDKYIEIYESNEIQEKYGGFPMIVVINDEAIEYSNDYFDVVALDYKLNKFNEKILAI